MILTFWLRLAFRTQLDRISLIVIVAEKRKGQSRWDARETGDGKIIFGIRGVSGRFISSRVASQNLWPRSLLPFMRSFLILSWAHTPPFLTVNP